MPGTTTQDGLFAHLERHLADQPCGDDLTLTRRWAAAAGHPEAVVVHLVEAHGGFCDCEVLTAARPRIVGSA